MRLNRTGEKRIKIKYHDKNQNKIKFIINITVPSLNVRSKETDDNRRMLNSKKTTNIILSTVFLTIILILILFSVCVII